MNINKDNFFIFQKVDIEINNFLCDGLVLDVGGGGEGVIGKLKGRDCVAIDIDKDELEESAEGPLKIIMDARALNFLDNSFSAATAFFSMMFVKSAGEQLNIFHEIFRVLKPGAKLYLWDIDLVNHPTTDAEFYLVHLQYKVNNEVKETSYGQRWPEETRNEQHYLSLAREAGFTFVQAQRNQHTFYLEFQKCGS
jgi:ubiquinone/menaquinone biosynthesis C-methylase UbiE